MTIYTHFANNLYDHIKSDKPFVPIDINIATNIILSLSAIELYRLCTYHDSILIAHGLWLIVCCRVIQIDKNTFSEGYKKHISECVNTDIIERLNRL
jgi:hypothetical protein